MHKLAPVEEAKTLFEAAKDWGVWQWLTGKPRARQTADAAWKALEEYEQKVKAGWSDDLRKAWRSRDADGEVARLKQEEREAHQAHLDAEAQFDEADRRMSASMARDGSQMAIEAWILREKLIRKMEALGRKAVH